jgi:hypothetical protein
MNIKTKWTSYLYICNHSLIKSAEQTRRVNLCSKMNPHLILKIKKITDIYVVAGGGGGGGDRTRADCLKYRNVTSTLQQKQVFLIPGNKSPDCH